VCHLDEAGFAPTLPTTGSWSPAGERLVVPYEAPQGRRVNVIGAHFTHGPRAGELAWVSLASLPKPRRGASGAARQEPEAAAERHGIRPDEAGTIDAKVLIAFLWTVGGRPADAPDGWKRPIPLEIWLDNYSVHRSAACREEAAKLEAARIHLRHLPSYCPELSGIEPVWQDVKYRGMTKRSHATLGELKADVDRALASKAIELRETTKLVTGAA
jgi:hypothetical protein